MILRSLSYDRFGEAGRADEHQMFLSDGRKSLRGSNQVIIFRHRHRAGRKFTFAEKCLIACFADGQNINIILCFDGGVVAPPAAYRSRNEWKRVEF